MRLPTVLLLVLLLVLLRCIACVYLSRKAFQPRSLRLGIEYLIG